MADSLRTIQQVANGKIDSAIVKDMSSYKIATVMVTNVDKLAAQFTIQVQNCSPAQVNPPATIISL